MAPSHDVENPAADPLLPAQDESDDFLTCHATPGGGDAARDVVQQQDWYSQPGVYRGIPQQSEEPPSDNKGLVASVATLLFSLPALGKLYLLIIYGLNLTICSQLCGLSLYKYVLTMSFGICILADLT